MVMMVLMSEWSRGRPLTSSGCGVLPGYRARPGGGGAECRGEAGSGEETQEDPEEGGEGPAAGGGEDRGGGGAGAAPAVAAGPGLPDLVRSPAPRHNSITSMRAPSGRG